ncbi:MAG: response regulator [Opitutaceae bacterium]|nr:response regulator [Opitutaceae bacterium]
MNASSSDQLVRLVQRLGDQLQAGRSGAAALGRAQASASELEQQALDADLALLAGAAICLQQRLDQIGASPMADEELAALAQAWLAHGPQLLRPDNDPALDRAWHSLQPLLTVAIEEAAPPAPRSGASASAPAGPADLPLDTGDFLASLDGGAAPPARAAAGPVPQAPAALDSAAAEDEHVPPEIVEAFTHEAREAFESMEQSIIAWTKNGGRLADLSNVYRLAHSVKGAAYSVGLRPYGVVLHRLEDLLEELVEGRAQAAPAALSALVLGLIDRLRADLASGEAARPLWRGISEALIARVMVVRASLTAIASAPAPEEPQTSGSEPAPAPAPPAAPAERPAPAEPPAEPEPLPAAGDNRPEQGTIRVETAHLDKLMNLVGDLLINRHRLNRKLQQVTSLRGELVRARERLLHVVGDFNTHYEFSQRRQSLAPLAADGFSELELDRYDDFNILARSLVEIAADAEEIVTQIDGHFGSFSEEAVQFTNVTRQLQENVAHTRMVPLDQLMRRLQRAVHDACSSEGKTVDFVAEGAENRVDKYISDQLFRPLLHVVRNAVAHGIEPAAERAAAGKPAAGRLLVRCHTEAGRLVLEFSDDGGGLRREAIVRVARARGLLGPKVEPDAAQLTEMIFQPGFSTTAVTTDVSGRGVGLDVVRQELTNLGGSVTVSSRPGLGCTFLFTLPVTLAINQVMFVQCGERSYALPINFVERVVPAPASAFSQSGGTEMLRLDSRQVVPAIRLQTRLGLPGAQQAATAIVLTVAERRTALIVDRIQSKLDIVVKALGPLLGRHPFFSGATLAGDGRVIFILDVPRLLAPAPAVAPGANADQFVPAAAPAAAEAPPATRSSTVLVVDDSLIIRRIAAGYLTQAGITVDTAVDGSEALEKLRANAYALVVSDLEMPRVNGFELIAEMRRQPELAAIPVIILTSRDAAKHRDRALELGAADYLIKPISRERLMHAVAQQMERAAPVA